MRASPARAPCLSSLAVTVDCGFAGPESAARRPEYTRESRGVQVFGSKQLPRQYKDDLKPAPDPAPVLILCRPKIEHALERSRFAPDPNSVLQYWRGLALMRLMTGESPLGQH